VVLALAVGLVWLQSSMSKVSADSWPILVNIRHLAFGTVFPGEEMEGTFTVTYSDDGDGVNYRIVQQRKPLPEEHPEYPDGGDPNKPGYYRDLCPHLTKTSGEGEGDMEGDAFVGGDGDPVDTWTIYFKAPAIYGQISQNHIGGVISESGEYGCDISIDILYEPASVCGYKFFDTDQDREFYGSDYGLPGWEINLLKETGCTSGESCENGWEIISTEITDEDGYYCHDSLQPGTYRVKEVMQDGWVPTIPTNPEYFEFYLSEAQDKLFDFGNYNEALLD